MPGHKDRHDHIKQQGQELVVSGIEKKYKINVIFLRVQKAIS